MGKIDRRKNYGILIDTETLNGLDCPLAYDFGYAIIDSKGNIYEERSFVISDTFFGMAKEMKSAYYADKIPEYLQGIHKGQHEVVSVYGLRRFIYSDCRRYNCKFIVAHNAIFDYRSTHNLVRYITKSKMRYLFPYGMIWYDTLKMSKQVLKDRKSYFDFCKKHGFVYGKYNNIPRFTAEVIYRYIKGNPDFEEVHKGLDDVRIEAEIFKFCVKQHKKMNKKLFAN